MTSHTTTPLLPQSEIESEECLFDNWFDPIEAGLRDRTRDFLQAMFEAELDEVLARSRYCRRVKPSRGDLQAASPVTGHRHGHRSRSLLGTFGKVEIAVPRARLNGLDGKTTEWKSRAVRAYQRRTLAADALIASCYLVGTSTRRVRRALGALFSSAVSRDTVSRVWRKAKSDWDTWNARALAEEPIVRLILDGTVVRVRLDRKATAVSLLVVIGVRADGRRSCSRSRPKALLTAHEAISLEIKGFLMPIAGQRPTQAPSPRFSVHIFAFKILRPNNPWCTFAELLRWQDTVAQHAPDRRSTDGQSRGGFIKRHFAPPGTLPFTVGRDLLVLPQSADTSVGPAVPATGRFTRTVQGGGDRLVWQLAGKHTHELNDVGLRRPAVLTGLVLLHA
jgi:hypothetical protein